MINVRQLSLALASLATLGLAAHPAAAQVVNNIPIANNSFEANSNTGAGYGTINSWTGGINTGVNTAAQPFADNGAIPDGTQVAFMQTNSAVGGSGNVQQSYIDQNLNGFVVGQQYVLTFSNNARAASGPVSVNVFFGGMLTQLSPTAGSLVTDTGMNIYSNAALTNVAAAGNKTTPYNTVNVTFTPTSTTGLLAFVGSGNGALLLDNVSIAPLAAAPEPSQSAALGLGILGLAGLVFTARKRSRLSA